MARYNGTFNFAANFEVLAKAPLDARQVVALKSDLISSLSWSDIEGDIWLYTGITVSVTSDPIEENNGLYFLLNAANYTSSSSWVKLSTGNSLSAWNGLSIDDNSIGLGGEILSDTSILLSDNSKLIIDGSNFEYSQDFSATFSERSIVDKGYVDNVFANSVKGYSGTFIGDGSTTLFDIPHNLGTLNQSITIYEADGLMAYPELQRGDNIDNVMFYNPPENGVVYSIVILGFIDGNSKGFELTIYGDDITTAFDVSHNMGTMSQHITVFDENDSIVYPDLKRGLNTDIITFLDAPLLGENYSVVIIGF